MSCVSIIRPRDVAEKSAEPLLTYHAEISAHKPLVIRQSFGKWYQPKLRLEDCCAAGSGSLRVRSFRTESFIPARFPSQKFLSPVRRPPLRFCTPIIFTTALCRTAASSSWLPTNFRLQSSRISKPLTSSSNE